MPPRSAGSWVQDLKKHQISMTDVGWGDKDITVLKRVIRLFPMEICGHKAGKLIERHDRETTKTHSSSIHLSISLIIHKMNGHPRIISHQVKTNNAKSKKQEPSKLTEWVATEVIKRTEENIKSVLIGIFNDNQKIIDS